MRLPLTAICGLTLLAAPGCATPPMELFNGRDFTDWEFVTTPAVAIGTVCTIQPDRVIAAAGAPVGFIATIASHRNYRLHAEWRWPGKPGNGGVLLHISSGPKDRAWLLSFQLQTKHEAVGELLPMAGATFAEPLTSAPGAAPALKAHTAPDSEQAVGAWNTCDITCRGDTIEVAVNGVVQNRVTGCSL